MLLVMAVVPEKKLHAIKRQLDAPPPTNAPPGSLPIEKSVKCYPGGRKIHIILLISEIGHKLATIVFSKLGAIL